MRLCPGDDHVIALVGSDDGQSRLPYFAPKQIEPLADFIENHILAGC
jgi:hypothetical protein